MLKRSIVILLAITMCLLAIAGCKSEPAAEAPTAAPVSTDVATATEAPKTDVDEPDEPTDEVVTLKQSPFLDGKGLPPIEERLPKVTKLPNQMAPSELTLTVGKYGGTLRTQRVNANYDATYMLASTVPLLNSPSLLGEEVTANIMESYEVSADNTVFTFKMREGMKWSDGAPLTTEDVAFAINDFQFNEVLNPGGIPAWLRAQGTPGEAPLKFEVIDDYTFKISFEKPYGGFLLAIAVEGWRTYVDLIKPKHYLKQFHPDYANADELEALIAEENFDPGDARSLFALKDITGGGLTQDPRALGFPLLTPWMMVDYGDITTYERNPYYFKVDSEGQQLPYIDVVKSTLVNDIEMGCLRLFGGEADHSYEWAVMSKVSMFIDTEAQSGLKTYTTTTLHRTAGNFMVNLTKEDETWQSAVSNMDFRRAINMSIDRDEVVSTVFLNYAKPYAPQNNYNPAEANNLLDGIGMAKGSDGYRVAPDGKKFIVGIDHRTDNMADCLETGELMVAYLDAIGINSQLKQIEGGLWDQRQNANELEGGMFFCPGPVMYFRPEWSQHIWAQEWYRWYQTSGDAGIEPTEEAAKEFFANLYSIRANIPAEAHKIWEKMVQSNADNFWFYQPTQEVIQPVALRATLRNFEGKGYAIANNIAGEQWWFDE